MKGWGRAAFSAAKADFCELLRYANSILKANPNPRLGEPRELPQQTQFFES